LNEYYYWIALSRLTRVGPVTAYRWLSGVENNIQALFSATTNELKQMGLSDEQIQELKKPPQEEIESDLHWCEKNRCKIIPFTDPAYPSLLRETHGAPIILYVQGDATLLLEPQIAIVGTRKPTALGAELAKIFAHELGRAGLIVVSGLAFGIDAASHRGALEVGKTIAVLGAGLQHIYPPQHAKLAEQILCQGALVSEFSPNTFPQPKHFPLRNRIISGLSLGVLVVEAALRSGSLITARYAGEQSREVFAIPGSIRNRMAEGCHHLIRQGAKLVEKAADIIEELGPINAARHLAIIPPKTPQVIELSSPPIDIDPQLQPVFTEIGYEVTALDVIIIRTGLTAGKVSSMLLTLELQGHVQAVPGGYVRAQVR